MCTLTTIVLTRDDDLGDPQRITYVSSNCGLTNIERIKGFTTVAITSFTFWVEENTIMSSVGRDLNANYMCNA